jgi:MHS family alpha-ketoglutarate permease-like MFS transporter
MEPQMTSSTVPVVGTRWTSGSAGALAGGTIGNFVEWFDWSVYGFFVPYFASQFFPGGGTSATLSTLLVFAISFFMRPVGAAVLGVYADRRGRRHGMTLTILLMAAGSLLIAIAPSYGAVGWIAPALLIAGSLLQGFSTGGEFGTSASFLVEWAKPGRRAFAGSFQQVSVVLGILCASPSATVLTRVLDDHSLSSWGWRIPFALGAVIGIGLYIRRRLTEPEVFRRLEEAAQRERRPLSTMAAGHRRSAWFVFGISIAGSVITYMWLTYLPTYAVLTAHANKADAQLANTIALAFFMVVLPFAALLSDRFGRRPTMLVYAVAFVILPFSVAVHAGQQFRERARRVVGGHGIPGVQPHESGHGVRRTVPTAGTHDRHRLALRHFERDLRRDRAERHAVLRLPRQRSAVPLYVSVCALVTGLFFYFMKETKTVDTHDVAMHA